MNNKLSININPQFLGIKNVDAFPLWTALITPFLESNQIDFTSLKKIAIAQANAGNGLLLLGSTGEGLALTNDEQLSIVEFVCDLQLNTPLMVAVGGYNLPDQINWINRCNELNIDSFLLGTPLYAKPGAVGQTQWFKALLDAAKFPCMLYNVPSRSGIEIPISTVQSLQSHPNCWAMKEASGDLNKFLTYRKYCPNIELYSGEDAMLPYLVPAGAKGLVSVCANAWPRATQMYVTSCLAGQTQDMFPLWNEAVEALFCVANPIPVKVLMKQQRNIHTSILRAPLTHLELTDNTDLVAFDAKINQWLAQASQPSFINTVENRNIA
jgi:4-hydroxy-tetrahydrodipicolinate synthase